MSKRDFEAIARMFKFFMQDEKSDTQTVVRMAYQFAHYYKESYPRFKESTFLQACGIDITAPGQYKR